MLAPSPRVKRRGVRHLLVPHAAGTASPLPRQLAEMPVFRVVDSTAEWKPSRRELTGKSGWSIEVRETVAPLTADHLDVLLGVLKLAGGTLRPPKRDGKLPVHVPVDATLFSLLRVLRRPYDSENRAWAKKCLDELMGTIVSFKHNGEPMGGGSIIAYRDAALSGDGKYQIDMLVDFANLFAGGYGKVDLERRKALDKNPTAKLVQAVLAVHRRSVKHGETEMFFDWKVSTWREKLGSSQPMRNFRRNLTRALTALRDDAGEIHDFAFLSKRGDSLVRIELLTETRKVRNNIVDVRGEVDSCNVAAPTQQPLALEAAASKSEPSPAFLALERFLSPRPSDDAFYRRLDDATAKGLITSAERNQLIDAYEGW